MEITLGLALDQPSFPLPPTGQLFLGPSGLIDWLEMHLGLSGHPNNIDHLRTEQYRQALQQYAQQYPDAFFQASLAADAFATAAELLSRRDELLLGGWDFQPNGAELPKRLATLAGVEKIFSASEFTPGFADRVHVLRAHLKRLGHPLERLTLTQPLSTFPPYLQQLIDLLGSTAWKKLEVITLPAPKPVPQSSDLGTFQQYLLQRASWGTEKRTAQGDGSLVLIKTSTANQAATFAAQLLRLNPDLRPLCLIPEKNRTLDEALIQEGLPSLGIPSASLARPSLQILKLLPAFIWDPIDPFKVLEFLSLPVKPLHKQLGAQLAQEIAQNPGLRSSSWFRTVNQFFDREHSKLPAKALDAAREEYEFWFERKRYSQSGRVPKERVMQMYLRVQRWAQDNFEDTDSGPSSLLVLSEQARRVVELLQALPEESLSFLELERIIRAIYEPSPVVFQAEQTDHLPFVHSPGAITQPTRSLLWWNFFQNEPQHFFSRWYAAERAYFHDLGVALDTPQAENRRLLHDRQLPVLQTQDRLILFAPKSISGTPTNPHPLLGDLEALFEDLSPLILEITEELPPQKYGWKLPPLQPVQSFQLGRPQPFIEIPDLDLRRVDHYETYSSLQALLYYPYQWVFRHRLRLRTSPILSVVAEETLMGNLSHRVFEWMLQEDFFNWDKATTEDWIDDKLPHLLRSEGAVLLLYGREPQKAAFTAQLKFAAWTLISLIRENGWEVRQVEERLEGELDQIHFRGITDLILEREGQLLVLDLKWTGASYREQLIKNEEDLQLNLYANLLREGSKWPETGYFIINQAKMLVRSPGIFTGVNPISPEEDHQLVADRIWQRMMATYHWRDDQLAKGRIEVRCTQTLDHLEDTYAEEATDLMDLLEMKDEQARYDDYRTLINLRE
jgi:ATP-dependent helicase/nuclease subunit B